MAQRSEKKMWSLSSRVLLRKICEGLFYRSSTSLEVSSLELLEFDGGEESFEVSSAEAVVIRSLNENVIF